MFKRQATKRRRIYVWFFVFIAIVVVAGVRTSTGQGYSNPIVSPNVAGSIAAPSVRTLEVRLTNRKSGRSQHYAWPLSVPLGSVVEIECHEWTHIHWFGVSLFGVPRNSFRRVVSHDAAEDGIAEPYYYIVRWRTKDTIQPSLPTPGLRPDATNL